MRRIGLFALALGLAALPARADIAPPPLEFVNVSAAGLNFLIIARDYSAPAHPTAQLIGCEEGHANCKLAHSRGLIGERLMGLDDVEFARGADPRALILAAFGRAGAPATIELDFEPATKGGPLNRATFARR